MKISAETRKAAAGGRIMKIDEKRKQMNRTKLVDLGQSLGQAVMGAGQGAGFHGNNCTLL